MLHLATQKTAKLKASALWFGGLVVSDGFRWFRMLSPLTDEVDLAPHAFMPHTRMLSRRFEASTHKFPKEAKEMENAVAGMKRKQQFFVHCKNSRNCGGGP